MHHLSWMPTAVKPQEEEGGPAEVFRPVTQHVNTHGKYIHGKAWCQRSGMTVSDRRFQLLVYVGCLFLMAVTLGCVFLLAASFYDCGELCWHVCQHVCQHKTAVY